MLENYTFINSKPIQELLENWDVILNDYHFKSVCGFKVRELRRYHFLPYAEHFSKWPLLYWALLCNHPCHYTVCILEKLHFFRNLFMVVNDSKDSSFKVNASLQGNMVTVMELYRMSCKFNRLLMQGHVV